MILLSLSTGTATKRLSGHASCCTLSSMRRPAVLAFTLFALAASLPAEVRECLPMAAGCGHRAATRGSSCARLVEAADRQACARKRPVDCPKTRPTRDTDNCRLHPTPPIALGSPTAIPAPPAAVLLETPVRPEVLDPSRAGWREAPALRPRASPASAPRSPRKIPTMNARKTAVSLFALTLGLAFAGLAAASADAPAADAPKAAEKACCKHHPSADDKSGMHCDHGKMKAEGEAGKACCAEHAAMHKEGAGGDVKACCAKHAAMMKEGGDAKACCAKHAEMKQDGDKAAGCCDACPHAEAAAADTAPAKN